MFCRPVRYQEDNGYYDDLPQPSEYYESEYLKLNPNLHEEDAGAKFDALFWALEGSLSNIHIATVLDVGCGSGAVLSKTLSYLRESRHIEVVGIGVDVSRRILEAGTKDHALVRIRADCRDIPLRDQVISLALCFDIIEHIHDVHRVIKEVSRLAQYAVFKVPLELSAYTWLRGGKQRLERLKHKYGHVNHYNRNSLIPLIDSDWNLMAEKYVKIPGRSIAVDKFQTLLLALGMSQLFAVLFGGFIIMVTRSMMTRDGN